jgi:hypothetical protein
MTYQKVDLALFIWYAIAVVFGNVMNLLAAGNKYPKMHVLICNFHWSRSQKYTKNLQLHIRVLHACREYE